MHSFLRNLLIFITPAVIYSLFALFFLPKLIRIQKGPVPREQIDFSFKNAVKNDYDLLILGNSRPYRGINPDMLTLKSYNFCHDDDSFNQIYYKLKYLEKNNKNFNHIILGIDYFQFSFKSDLKNYAYADYFDSNYLNDYENSNLTKQKLDYYLDLFNPKKLKQLNPKKNKNVLKSNGFFINPGQAKADDFIERDISVLPFQEAYFQKILKLCESKNIKVFIVMMPLRDVEYQAYDPKDIKNFNTNINKYVDNKNVFYFNYSLLTGFSIKDYTDITHFSEQAANRFTKILDKNLMAKVPIQ